MKYDPTQPISVTNWPQSLRLPPKRREFSAHNEPKARTKDPTPSPALEPASHVLWDFPDLQ